jgi:dihydrofolate reductase
MSRKIIASTFVSLNGYFAGPNGEQDWTFPYLGEELRGWMSSEGKTYDTIILGEGTYKMLSTIWPNMGTEQDPAATFMNATPKIIISKSLKEAPWGTFDNASVLNKDISGELKKLKQQDGGNMLIVGSGTTIQLLTNEGLIDEYETIILPVILNAGRLLFANIKSDHALKLLDVKTFKSGVVMHRYQPS